MRTDVHLISSGVMMIMFRISSHSEDSGIVGSDSWEESAWPREVFPSPPG